MKSHDHQYGDCPRCGGALCLTTEWGWVDERTCTAILCCATCRTETGFGEAAVVGCDAATETEALDGVDVDELRSQMRAAAQRR